MSRFSVQILRGNWSEQVLAHWMCCNPPKDGEGHCCEYKELDEILATVEAEGIREGMERAVSEHEKEDDGDI